MRAFFAINIPFIIEEMIESLKKTFPQTGIRWTKPSNLHITLQFIQALKPEDLNTLIYRVQHTVKNIKPFYLTFGHFELFPSDKHPHIISLAVGPHEKLESLAAYIGKELKDMNYVVDNRPFRGHLTIARLKNLPIDATRFTHIPKISSEKIFIQEIILFESKPSQEGSNYITLARIALDAAR